MLCKVELTNNFITIIARNYLLEHISKKFTYRDISQAFTYGRFQKHNVRIVKLLKFQDEQHAGLPIGLFEELKKLLDNIENLNYQIVDHRQKYAHNFTDDEIKNCLNVELRPYQIDAVKMFLKEQQMIIKSATASGKTKIMAAIIRLLDVPTLVLAHKKDLVHQTEKKFREDGLINVGIVQGTNYRPDKITIATIQSARKIDPTIRQNFKMVFVDEVHRANAPTYQTLLSELVNAHYKLGLSATPFSKDKLHNALVKAWFGEAKFDLGAKQLVDEGWLAEPTIHIVPINKVTQRKKLKSGPKIYNRNIQEYGWVGAERGGIIHNHYRNEKIVELAKNAPEPVLVLVKNIIHGEKLNKMIPNSVFIYGDTKVEEREQAIKEFEEGKEIILIGSTILDEGIDIQELKTLIVTAGGKSFIRALQRLGRALRKTDTKREVVIYDFYDATNRYLERHSKARIDAYRKEGFNKIIVDKRQR